MQCWICGSEATTGEHLLKASSMRDLFGEVTQQKPIYLNSARGRNRRVQSIDTKLLKLRVLCGRCNSNLTQPFDRAWDTFWTYLNENEKGLNLDSRIRFYRVFGHHARKKTLNLHLYAVKLFGCVAAEFSIPMDLVGMANAITQRRPYPNIFVGLGKSTLLDSLTVAGPSDVETAQDDTGKCVFAVWFLTIGRWEFQFIYAVPGQRRDGMPDTWNPVQSRVIYLKEFGELVD